MAENKRSRCTNFTIEEKLCVLSIIQKYKHIIENKETGVLSWKNKNDAWKVIEKEYNSTSTIYRPMDVLKRFYNNKKKETRKYAANAKFEMKRTGGGESVKAKDDPVYNLTLDIINKKTVFGLKNKFDSDEVNVSSYITKNDETETGNSCILEPGSDEQNEVIILEMEEDDAPFQKNKQDLDEEVSCTFEQQDPNVKVSDDTPKIPRKKYKQNSTSASVKNWQSGRRPELTKIGNIALRYEEVAEIKKEVMQVQLKVLQAQEIELKERYEGERKQRQLQERRENIEFELRKKALELDVEIKQAQLVALRGVESNYVLE